MFTSIEQVQNIFEYILADTGKTKHITHLLGQHTIYKDSNKYSRITRLLADHSTVQLYAHQLALLYKEKKTALSKDLECSHLCHYKGCINVDHIIEEPHGVNMSRKACVNERRDRHDPKFCFGHQEYPDCI